MFISMSQIEIRQENLGFDQNLFYQNKIFYTFLTLVKQMYLCVIKFILRLLEHFIYDSLVFKSVLSVFNDIFTDVLS